jgi:hypothetical protein
MFLIPYSRLFGPAGAQTRWWAPLLLALTLNSPAVAQTLITPSEHAGFPLGADNHLLGWTAVLEYMHLTDRASDRVQVVELGQSTLGRPFAMVIVSSEENMRNLDQLKQISRRLYDPDSIPSEDEAARLIARGRAVVAITCGLHATEIGNSQMSLEVVHRLATEESPEIRNILDNVILLFFPSINPDGLDLVVDWHNETFGTAHQGASMPWLYHHYTGHDNNRDAYMFTQVETRLLGQVLYHDWYPQVWLDKHQMGGSNARMFVMPAAGPPNPNVDPWIYRMAGFFGFAQGQALDAADKPGVVYGSTYTYWWQGAMGWAGWWHNMIGMLTEVASANLATPVYQRRADLPRDAPLPSEAEGLRVTNPPRDIEARPEYLVPWMGGRWSLRDIMDYQAISVFGLLEAAAGMRSALLSGIVEVNRRTVERGREGNPWAVVIPVDQHDPLTTVKLLQTLFLGGVRIEQATEPFTADGTAYPAGTYVIPMGQVFRNYVKDLLEPQHYPSQTPPYDVSGWSLGMQMGTETVFVAQPFTYRGRDAGFVPTPEGRPVGRGTTWLLDGRINDSHTAALELLRRGVRIGRMSTPLEAQGIVLPAGTFVADGLGQVQAEQLARRTGLSPIAVTGVPTGIRWMSRAPRVGLFQAWGGNMDEGWTRWLLEQFGFEPIVVHPEVIREAGDLREHFDVIIFPDGNPSTIMQGGMRGNAPPRYQGGIDSSGLEALKAFARSGGTLITLGGSTPLLLEEFEAPFTRGLAGLNREQFFCPGSLLEVQVDATDQVAWGMPDQGVVMFANDLVLEPAEPGALDRPGISVVVRFGDRDPLRSGWLRGPEHLYGTIGGARMAYGRGTLVLLPLRVQRRAQSHNTFKLLFNPIMNSVFSQGR